MNVKEMVRNEICCGCGVCDSACPFHAIEMRYSESDWQLYPEINSDLCTNCGRCVGVCPAINDKKSASFSPYGYAAVAQDEIREGSASGGMFYLLAKNFIQRGGYVAGAVYGEGFAVSHIVSNDMADVERMRGSKYVQSDARAAYREIYKLLSEKKQVLFCGTPCQVAALKNYVGENRAANLLCVDLICHGVPSHKFFQKYLEENFDVSEIDNILFRNKKHLNGHPGSVTIVMKNGKEYFTEYFDNSFYKGFSSDLLEREACFDCKFAEFPRVGDLSIGDFWGAKTTQTKIDYEKGCSIITVNSPAGEKAVNQIIKNFKTKESYPLETLMSWNRNKRTLKKNPHRSELIPLIKKHNSLRTAVDMILNDRYDVGVFGVTMNPNFGGLITYWALYDAIEKMGYRAAIIGRPLNAAGADIPTHSTEFFKRHCKTTPQQTHADLPKLCSQIDRFVLGSDQVWNYNLFRCWDNTLYLDFVRDDAVKIAYAASFGGASHSIPNEKIGQVSKYLKHFDYVGVREADAVNILKNDYSVDATHVMDPVFLVDRESYVALSKLSKLDTNKKYVGAYIIEPNDFKLEVVKKFTEHLGVDNLNITDGDRKHFERKSKPFYEKGMHLTSEATIYDWLNIIINSEFVVTDSYHAVCFCIMFNKPFVILQERWALSRIQSIMNIFGLHDRWLQISNINDFKINETWFLPLQPQTKNILANEVAQSANWLRNALVSSKTITKNEGFSPYIEKTRVEDYFFFLLQKRKDIVIVASSASIHTDVLSAIDFKCRLSYQKFSTDRSKAFAMLYDFDNDYLETKNSDYCEIKYRLSDKQLNCLVDRSSIPFANNIYVFGKGREMTKLNPNAPLVISVYSKSAGRLVDSFEVYLENGVAMIKR